MNTEFLNKKNNKLFFYQGTDCLNSNIKYQIINEIFINYNENNVLFYFDIEKKYEALEIIKFKIDSFYSNFEVYFNNEKITNGNDDVNEIVYITENEILKTVQIFYAFEKKILESKNIFFELCFKTNNDALLASAAVLIYPIYNDYPDEYFFNIEFLR